MSFSNLQNRFLYVNHAFRAVLFLQDNKKTAVKMYGPQEYVHF